MSTPPQWGIPVYLIAILAALLAVVLAWRRPDYRPVAAFLSSMVAVDLGRLVLARTVDFEGAPRPHVGVVRLAFHADETGFLAWPFGLAALALFVFAARRPWAVLGAYVATVAALVVLYPSPLVRGVGLQRVYLAIHLAGLIVYVASVLRWRAKPTSVGPQHVALFVLGGAEVVRLLSFSGPIVDQWAAWMPPGNGVLYAVISAVEGVYLWVRRD